MGLRLDVVSACEMGLIDMTFRYSFIVSYFCNEPIFITTNSFRSMMSCGFASYIYNSFD